MYLSVKETLELLEENAGVEGFFKQDTKELT